MTFRLTGKCLRDEENDEIIIDFSVVHKLKRRDDDSFHEVMIPKETDNYEIEMVDDKRWWLIKIKRR